MNFDWIKAPKSEKEEKEQFDKLYHLLVQLSDKGKDTSPTHIISEKNTIESPKLNKSTKSQHEKIGDLDEFMKLKLDILSNFKGGVEITPLQTCRGCEHSFYSEGELEKHLEQSHACLEWTKRNPSGSPKSYPSFFSFMETGFSTLLQSSSCIFCHKSIPHRKALEKHYQQSTICNHLAYDTFQSWYKHQKTI